MKSPFPGMDPYIEASGLWPDFHDHLIEKIYETLADAAPERYFVRTGERSYVVLAEEEGKASHPFLPDVGVTSPVSQPSSAEEAGVATLTEEASDPAPVELRAFIEEQFRESFVEIYESEPETRLITCIEVLSPSNKRRGSLGWDLYLRKRQALLLGEASLVEIDLLRGGQRLPMLDPWPNSPYTLLVARRSRAPYCRVWPAHFQRPLPIIPIPLSRPDPDLSLNLQPLIESISARSRYHRSIDYAKPLAPPLTSEQAVWLEQQLRARQALA